MTSDSSPAPQNTTSPAATNATAPSAPATSRQPSSGPTSSPAAVSANAPPRVSYANIASTTTKKAPPTGPGASSSSPSTSQGSQHARSASSAAGPVNGRITPAVPSVNNSGNAAPNGTSVPFSGGQHSRKSSVASMPAGRNAPAIKFGGFGEPGAAPMRTTSPGSSPSPAPQPLASGGPPPQAGQARQLQFGDATSSRPASMPPVGPGSGMAPQGHARRDSNHSVHGESGPNMPHNRGMTGQGRGRNQPYNQYNNGGYGRGYNANPNYRNNPNMGGPQTFQPQQQYPNSPRNVHRSPAMTHASPSLTPAVPTATPQLYQQTPPFMPGSPHVNYMQPYDPNFYAQQGYPQMAYPPYASTSPRTGFVTPQMGAQYYPHQQPAPMSRSSSQNPADIHQRPASGMGHHPTPPAMTPQPTTVLPVAPGTPVQTGQASPYGTPNNRPRNRAPSKALEIKNPETKETIKIETKPASSTPLAASAASPVVTSTPSPAPQHSADAEHTRSGKTDEEKRQAMRDQVKQKLAEAKRIAEEEEKAKAEKQKAEENSSKDADEKAKAEADEKAKKEAEEKSRKEAEEKAKKEAEEKAKEAEEKAQKEDEEKKAREAEEQKRAEAERLAKKAELEAKEKAAAEQAEKAKADAAATAVIEKTEEAKIAEQEKSEPAADKDSESMPPPPTRGAAIEKPKSKPSPLNLQIRTNEPAPPSAALTALKSARPIENIKALEYPEGIQSPNPALNPASSTKFKYDKDFLLQFQNVFTDKPNEHWDQKMRETVGEPDSARPGTARTPSNLGPRQSSRSGAGAVPPMGGMGSGMGSFGAFTGAGGSMGGSFRSGSASNPLASMFAGRPAGLARNPSSASISGSGRGSNADRPGNKPARGNGSKRGSNQERDPSQKGGPTLTIPIDQVKPLEASATRWKPPSALKKAVEVAAPPAAEDQPLMSPEMVQRKVKAALNKMTPEKFDKIADQILEITGQSRFETDGRTLRQVIQLTFEKATDEQHWSSMYAKFCKRMLEAMDPNIKDDDIRDKHDNVVTGGNLFRKYLLNRCQEEFEKGWKVNLPPKPEGESEDVMLSDEYYIAAAAKRRGLGLVQFIGELFKLNMLTERIMNECVRKTLDFEGVPEDETVESLCKLLRTIGSLLDASEKSRPRMDMYFQRIDNMITNKDLNSRMRFMLMDIVDLRKKGWETKEADKGPKTISEIREEAAKALAEKEAASRANRSSRPPAGRGDARSFSQGGFNPPQSSGGTVNMDDLRKLRNRQTNSTQGSFGPPSMLGNRGSNSSGRRGLGPGSNRDDSGPNSRTATPPVPSSTASVNAFHALAMMGNDDHGDEKNDTTSPPTSVAGSPQVTEAQLDRVISGSSPEESKETEEPKEPEEKKEEGSK